ncbi:MAG: 50S ribosomal protein L9 [bacterium]
MKIILLRDHPELGKQGDLVETKDGYARNYLIPRELAEEATSGALRTLEQRKFGWKKREDRELAEARKTAATIEGNPLVLLAEAGESGKLFGSVTAQDIVDAIFSTCQTSVERKRVLLEESIRTLGKHKVPIKLHRELTIEVELEVKAKE